MGAGDDKNKPQPEGGPLDEWQPNSEQSLKHGYEDKGYERGVGNRKPEKPPEGESKTELSVGPFYKWESSLKGAMMDSRPPGSQETSFAQFMQGKVGDMEFASASVNLTDAKAKAVVFKAKAEGSVVHAELDLVDTLVSLFMSEVKKPPAEPPLAPAVPPPMAARLGDLTTHGSPLMPGLGSPNVLIGGMPAWRVGIDTHLCPFPGAAPHGMGTALPGAATVLINGMPAARAGDALIEPVGGPNMIVLGCPTVFIGPQAPPPAPPKPPEPPKAELPWVKFASVAKADALAVEADAQVYGEVDFKKGKGIVEAQAGLMVAALKGEIPLKVRVLVPGTEYYLGLGLTLEGSLLSAGAEAGGGLKINEGGKAFDLTGGAKVGAGLGGVGVKFGVDIAK